MSYAPEYEPEYRVDLFAVDAAAEERAAFIRRTYLHLGGAVLAFVGLEAVFLSTPAIYEPLVSMMAGNWWLMLIAFIAVSWVAQSWAQNSVSRGTQYAGLFLFVVAEAVIFVPLLWIAATFGGPSLIPTAGLFTALIFTGLTGIVFISGADFSFLRNILWLGTLGALGAILAGALFGFSLGLVFVVAMVVLAAGWILHDTSNVLHHYRTDQHVGAALQLFASVALMFWYVIQLLLSLQGD